MSAKVIDRNRVLFSWAMLTPFLLLFAIFVVYPLIQSAFLAANQTFGPGTRTFVGTKNFQLLLADPVFWKSIGNTFIYALGSLFIQLPLAFALALALNSSKLRGKGIYRLIFFSPQLMGLVFVSILGALAFEKRAGLVNQAIAFITRNEKFLEIDWLQQHVMATLILISLWLYVGFNMIYFLAALQSVDKSLMEAAEIDGAGPLGKLRHVIYPSVKPVATFVILLSMIGSLQLFELPYILLESSGGPDNRGLTIVMYLYQNGFDLGDLGYASAIGWVLALILIALALVQIKMTRAQEVNA
ncbi:MAG: lactose ABC transporter permease [Phycisphaerae bacterium]|nr:lactose ABC transporter permease [Phycisphaerae bacterium]MBM90209.1 lactose ABC transporter permease [Phycisphaerae bacterium]